MSVKKQSKTQTKPKVTQAKPVESPPNIEFDAAVKLGKELAAAIKFNEMEIGRLAHRLKPDPRYGAQTLLKKFAQAIGIPYGTVKRYRTVFRKYKDKQKEIGEISPRLPFAVLSALAPVDDPVSILQAKPDMKTPEARTIARAERAKKGRQRSSRSRNDAGAIRAVLELAQKVHKEIGHVTLAHIDAAILRDELKDPAQAYAILHRAGQDIFNLEDIWKEALATLQPAPAARPDMWDDAKLETATLADAQPEEATPDEAKLEAAE